MSDLIHFYYNGNYGIDEYLVSIIDSSALREIERLQCNYHGIQKEKTWSSVKTSVKVSSQDILLKMS